MVVHAFNQFSIRASNDDLFLLRDFYCRVIGLTLGPTPPGRSAGFWLYANDLPVLQLASTLRARSLVHVRNRRRPTDHVAFASSGLHTVVDRLRANRVQHWIGTDHALQRVMLTVHDPAGVRVEIAFQPEAEGLSQTTLVGLHAWRGDS